MLRILAKKRSILATSVKPIFRSIAQPQQKFFSSSLLDEGEYIEGDFDTSAPSANKNGQTEANSFKKKFVDLENFENNLSRKMPRPKTESKQAIANSVSSLKDKLKFELAADDEFAQSLQNRQKKLQSKPEDKAPRDKKALKESHEKKLRDTINKLYKEESAQGLEAKNLTPINFEGMTPEAKAYDPIKLYNDKFVKNSIDNSIQTNQAIEEYVKGEEGVDYIHPAESLTKAYADVHNELINEVMETKALEVTNKKDRLALEDWRLERGITQIDLTGLEDDPIPYPGSSKGPSPNDDPDFYAEWLFANMNPGVREFYRELEEESAENRDMLEGSTTDNTGYEGLILTDVPNADLYYTRPEINLAADESGQGSYHSPIEAEMNGVAPLPDFLPEGYQTSQPTIEKWAMFRMYPIVNQWMRAIHTSIDHIKNGRIPHEERRIHSLFRYYYLLPEFVRNNPIIINTVRCLEFSKHDMTLEQKEIALNMACEFTIPLTAYEEEVYAEAIISTKREYPIWEEKVLLRQDDDKDSKDAMGRDRKKNVVPLALMDMRVLERIPESAKEIPTWPEPPALDPHTPEEDPFPVLPLDYYENDDGFWDDYINYKEQSHGTFPLLKRRPYFKHH